MNLLRAPEYYTYKCAARASEGRGRGTGGGTLMTQRRYVSRTMSSNSICLGAGRAGVASRPAASSSSTSLASTCSLHAGQLNPWDAGHACHCKGKCQLLDHPWVS